jgi:membrane protein YdbS with pleckstrin-like domain
LSGNAEGQNDMFCNQCGQSIPAGSKFCNHCGSTLAAVAVQSENLPVSEEQVVFVLRPTLIFVITWYFVAALVVLAVAAGMGMLRGSDLVSSKISWAVIGAAAVIMFAIPVYKHILRLREVYTLTNHKLEMRFGLIAKTVRNIPLRNVQDVTVTSSVWERVLGLGDIVIDSASEAGKIVLSNIHHPERYADQILSELRRHR